MGKRLNIALCIAMLENEFSYSICEGALMGAEEIDANLFIFPGGIIDATYDDKEANYFRYQYNTLYSCVPSRSIDAIVIEYGTIVSVMDVKKREAFLKQFGDIPVVLITGSEDGYSTVEVDNKAGIREALNHLINEHGLKKIGFVSGPETNQDAMERLDAYKETMTAAGLECGPELIAYGNFSEFSEEVVGNLLDENPDIEGLMFANDRMAIGGYKAMEMRGLVPGKDIMVIGFDDSPTAMSLKPHLASVKADTREVAYKAVCCCRDIVGGNIVNKSVDAKLVIRESCGCGDDIKVDSSLVRDKECGQEDLDQFADELFKNNFNGYFENQSTEEMKQRVRDYVSFFSTIVDKNGKLVANKAMFTEAFAKLVVTYEKGYVELPALVSVNYTLSRLFGDRISTIEDRFTLIRYVSEINEELLNRLTEDKLASEEKMKLFQIVLTNITRDMLQSSKSERKKYDTVITKLRVMDFASSYIYAYEDSKVHKKKDKWHQPDKLYCKAYHDGDTVKLYGERPVAFYHDDLFSASIMPKDRRINMLVMPLFSGDDQYGLMLTEADANLQNFSYASQIACQVSVSLQVIEIIKQQNAIKKELEDNLAAVTENNKILNQMSYIDPLTGVNNRRGYNEKVRRIIQDPANRGKRAVAMYADMDCLKVVNDDFGHDEGDFSLKTIAKALSESFRTSDVVARMGGDEFAAFALVSCDNFAEIMEDRVRSVLSKLNDNDKPYYVGMSIGTYEFTVEEGIDIDVILNLADENLYQEKKKKKKVVYKA